LTGAPKINKMSHVTLTTPIWEYSSSQGQGKYLQPWGIPKWAWLSSHF